MTEEQQTDQVKKIFVVQGLEETQGISTGIGMCDRGLLSGPFSSSGMFFRLGVGCRHLETFRTCGKHCAGTSHIS